MVKPTALQLVKEIERDLDRVKEELKEQGDDVKAFRDLAYEVRALKDKVKQLEELLKAIRKEAISKDRYTIVEKIVFGLVGLVLVAFATYMINGVIVQ